MSLRRDFDDPELHRLLSCWRQHLQRDIPAFLLAQPGLPP
jgi:hypothetical protein